MLKEITVHAQITADGGIAWILNSNLSLSSAFSLTFRNERDEING